MKVFYYVTLLLSSLAIVISCSSSTGNNENSRNEELSYHEQANILMALSKTTAECIEIQEKAVAELKAGKAKESAFEILSQMGYFYSRNGEYLNAMQFLQEATDSMRNTPVEKVNLSGATRLLGNTANLYCRMGLYEEALAINNEAIQLNDTNAIPDLWRMRATIFMDMSLLDSAMMCHDRAILASNDIIDKDFSTFQRVSSENVRAWTLIEYPKYLPDSIPSAIATLERNLGQGFAQTTDSLLLGRGYALTGNRERGIALMKATIPNTRQQNIENLEYALKLLSQSLIESELSPKSLEVYEESQRLTDTINSRIINNALLGADFKYRTSQISSEKKLLEMKLQQTRERTIYICSFLVILICIAITFFTRRYRLQRQLLHENTTSLQNLINDRIELNRRIETLNAQLVSQRQGGTGTAPEISDILTMTLLTKTDEQRFRQLFTTIHPGFIEKIRADYPNISGSNEIICMMIRLRKSNEEISLALGIKRESVAKARYRLRTLFNLPKEVELNDFIASL